MAGTYNPKDVVLSIDGLVITGFAEDSKISIEKNEDNVVPHVGIDGNVDYSIVADDTQTMTISLAGTSPHLNRIRRLGRGRKQFSVSLVDLNDNGENMSADSCVVLKSPGTVVEKEIAEYEIDIFIP